MTRGTQETCTFLSGIGSHRGYPGHPTLSSWPVFKSPGTHSPFVWFGHFPTGLLTPARTSSLLRPGQSPAPSLPAGRGGILLGTSVAAHRPVHSRYLRLCLSRLPSLLSWSGPSVARGRLLPRAFWRCHPREPRWIPCCPGVCPLLLPLQHSPDRRCLSWKRCLPDVPVTPVFLPPAVRSVTLFVNSS